MQVVVVTDDAGSDESTEANDFVNKRLVPCALKIFKTGNSPEISTHSVMSSKRNEIRYCVLQLEVSQTCSLKWTSFSNLKVYSH